MLKNIINPLAITIALTTTVGVLVHDTQLDRATTLALTLPTALAAYAAVDVATKSGDHHVHVERASAPKNSALRATIPRLVPRDDDKRSMLSKKIGFGQQDGVSLWPSV